MNDYIKQFLGEWRRNHKRRRQFLAVIMVLSVIVAGGVVWQLRGVGISMTDDAECGKTEHKHMAACYREYLICGLNEGDPEEVPSLADGAEAVTILHEHSDSCYKKEMICEIDEHIHTAECLGVTEKVVQDASGEVMPVDVGPTEGDLITLPDGTTRELGVIYVNTKLGERHKDYISEYLNLSYIYIVIEQHYGDAYFIKDENGNYNYVKNFFVEPGLTRSMPYLLRPPTAGKDGDEVELVYYTKASDGIVTCEGYNSGTWTNGDGSLTYLPAEKEHEDDFIADGHTLVQANVDGNGTNRISVKVKASSVKKDCRVVMGPAASPDYFYIFTGEKLVATCDHADIEVSDGGSFVITTTRKYEDGSYDLIVTEYTSFISKVESGVVHTTNGDVTYTSDKYREKSLAEMGGQVTQVEFTSKDCGVPAYDRNTVLSATFTVDLSLEPKEIRSMQHFDAQGDLVPELSGKEKITLGTKTIVLNNYVFELGEKSVVDAFNKCPDTSGLDFNITATQLELVINPPASYTIKALKTLDNSTFVNREFEFELLDSEGSRVGNPVKNNSSGEITFDNLYFYAPGTYTYTLKEIIPAGATGENNYEYNGIRYDTKVHTLEFDVELDDTFYNQQLNISDGQQLTQYLVTTVKIDGVVVDTITHTQGQNNPYVFTPSNMKFENETCDYDYKELIVRKEWSDGVHGDKDRILFRVYSIADGVETPLNENGSTLFELSASNGWQKSFGKVLTKIGDTTYTFRVEEIGSTQYVPIYESPVITGNQYILNIRNEKKADVEIGVQKVWDVPDGITLPESVRINLKRRYKDVPLPVLVTVKEETTGITLATYAAYGYYDKKITVPINSFGANLAAQSAENCSSYIDGNTLTIQEIREGASVVLTCPQVDTSKFKIYATGGSDFDSWRPLRGDKNNCYYTNYSTNFNADGSTGLSCIQLKNGTETWRCFEKSVDGILIPGETYSFSDYEMWKRPNPVGGYADTVELSLTLRYKTAAGETRWMEIASATSMQQGEWMQIKNTSFTIPEGAADLYILTTISEPGATEFVDVFADDIIVAEANQSITVEKTSGKLHYDVSFGSPQIETPGSVENWAEDGAYNKAFELNAGNEWKTAFSSGNLDELPHRIYQYYVVEDMTAEEMSFYKVSYENNDGVSATDEDNPIVVKNTLAAYELPHTGSIGGGTVQMFGILLIAGATVTWGAALWNKRKKVPQKVQGTSDKHKFNLGGE